MIAPLNAARASTVSLIFSRYSGLSNEMDSSPLNRAPNRMDCTGKLREQIVATIGEGRIVINGRGVKCDKGPAKWDRRTSDSADSMAERGDSNLRYWFTFVSL